MPLSSLHTEYSACYAFTFGKAVPKFTIHSSPVMLGDSRDVREERMRGDSSYLIMSKNLGIVVYLHDVPHS